MSPARRRAVAVTALAAVLWLTPPGPAAWAHAYLLASTPSAGYAVAIAPTALSLDFDQPVTIGATPLALADATGHQHPLAGPVLSLGGRRLSAKVPEQLADGGYRIHWEVIAEDGDVVAGTITFAVGSGAAALAGDTSASSAVDSPVVIGLRWLLFVGLFLALGGLVGDWLTRRVVREARSQNLRLERPRPFVVAGAGLGTVAASGLALDQAGLGPARLPSTPAGLVVVVEAVGFLVAAVLGLLARDRLISGAAVVPLLAVVAAEGMRAHPHADSPVLGTALTIVHLVAAGVWVGALVHVLRTARAWRGQTGWTRLLVYDYGRLAVVLVAVVIATGAAEAVLVLPSLAALVGTLYGLVLLAKLAFVVAVVVLAWLARRRLSRSRRARAVHPLGRAARSEIVVLAAVLAVTAVLVSVAPARPATADLAAPPAVSGVVVPVGALAGQVTVVAEASAGQLVIRMSTPDRDDLGSDVVSSPSASGEPPYRLAAGLVPDGQPPRALTLRGCGAGCFTTPVAWRTGTNHLRLSVAAAPWHGGAADLDITWPPRTDPPLLAEVLAAMRSVPHIVVHEAVTSDYAGYPGTEAPLSLTGEYFLSTEPYGAGGGTPVVLASTPDDTEIGLAFPQGQVVRLFVGTDHRILHEEYVTPNHLITPTFEYPP